MATEQIKSTLLIELFKLNREKLNSLFNFYKLMYPVIERDVVFFYIYYLIEPILEKNSQRDKDKLSAFLLSLYEKNLELIGKNFLGNSGRYPFFENKFIAILEDSNDWMFENPDSYLSSIANAIINLGTVDSGKLEIWTLIFQKLAKKAKNFTELLEAGKVAAWICGMAQYRAKALEISKTLSIDLLEIVLGNSNIRNINREKFIARLEADPWLNLESALKENSPKKKFHLKRVGKFIGFLGEFLTPPKVEFIENEFIVYDSKNFYVLFTDLFGSHLQRISEDVYLSLPPKDERKFHTGFVINKDGKVKKEGVEIQYLPLANYSSVASNETTLCVTSPGSHSIFVLGLG